MKNFLILAIIFIVAFVQYYLGLHKIEWGYASAFALPFLLYLIKYGFSFKNVVHTDEEDNIELDHVFILILLSITMNVVMYYLGLDEFQHV